jgi:hypothetical protein
MTPAEVGLPLLLGPPLWLLGAIGFDAVHWGLHRMLRSRFAWLRALAWPHGVHHQWVDRELAVHYELQRRNVWCHIVPEYLTQLTFTALLALWLPPAYPAVVFALQTLVFLGVLHARGLDRNHQPVRLLDAYRPGPWTPPAYHALHHVHPDAYFSSYTKAVDALLGAAAQLAGRRFAICTAAEGPNAFASALARELARQGVEVREVQQLAAEPELARLDVLVWCDPAASPVPAVEACVRATRERQLPPEVWALHARSDDASARHYHDDVRVSYRTLQLAPQEHSDPDRARRAARRVVSRIRRGAHFVSSAAWPRALAAWLRFRRTAALRPEAAVPLRHRVEALT